MLGKKIKVKAIALDGETKTSEETAAVTYDYPEIVSAVRKAANSFTLNFDSDASEIVEADDIIVISEDETDVKKITGLDFDQLDGTTAVVTVNTPFKDGVTYNVIYGDSSASFVASVGEVASIVISTRYAEVNTKTPIEFALFDENGVDVTSAIKVDETCTVTFTGDYSNYENTKASAATVTMATAGDECEVKVEYNKNDGVSDIIDTSKIIECIPAGEKHGTPFFKAGPTDLNDTDNCFRFYDPKNSADSIVAVALNADKLVHFYAQDDDGSAISYDSYEIESADETIATVLIDKATGKWASFTVTGNSRGLVLLTLTATKNGAKTTYDIPVTVTEQAFPTKVTLNLSKKSMSNAWDEDYYGTVTMKVTAADGSDADTDTYNNHGFEILTKDRTVDDDLKTIDLYAEGVNTGFQLVDADADDVVDDYTAFAAHGGSYVIEGSVTSLDTGKVLKATNTVTVSELPKEAWYVPNADGPNDQQLYILKWGGIKDDDQDEKTGLTKAETAAYPLLTQDEYEKLNPLTTLPGQLINRQAQKDPGQNGDANYAGVVELDTNYDADDEMSHAVTASGPAANVIDAAKESFVLATVDNKTGIATVIDTSNALRDIYAAPNDKKDKKTVYKITAIKGKKVVTAKDAGTETISKDQMANANKTALPDSTIFKVVPKYATQVVPGKDAYDDSHLVTTKQKGVDTSYAVEMTKTMGYAAKTNKKTARLYATMGGLFAGYVKDNGSIGVGKVVPTIEKRIINLGTITSKLKDKATIDVQTYFGKTVVGTEENDITTSPLYNVKNGRNSAPVRVAQGDPKTIGQTFITVSGAPNSRLFTAQKDQIKYDDDFARTGTEYKVVFRFWYVTSTKPVEESAAFSVQNDLYTPKVSVKSQILDSYTQDGWKDAVTSEVDLNNDSPSTYSVIDLVDKDFDTISSKTTPAKWAVVTEEGILFYIPLDRSFSLS